MEKLLTISEAADYLRLHIVTLRRWSDSGRIKTYRVGKRGDRRFKKSDIEALLVSDMDK